MPPELESETLVLVLLLKEVLVVVELPTTVLSV
jgi:hypothetical protein